MKEIKIDVISLGYVRLSLVRLFSMKYSMVEFDLNPVWVNDFLSGYDSTLEVADGLLLQEAINTYDLCGVQR